MGADGVEWLWFHKSPCTLRSLCSSASSVASFAVSVALAKLSCSTGRTAWVTVDATCSSNESLDSSSEAGLGRPSISTGISKSRHVRGSSSARWVLLLLEEDALTR